MGRMPSAQPSYVPGEFGPNDQHFDASTGTLKPGLGTFHRPRMNGREALPDPPDKAKLRAQAAALAQIERELTVTKADLEAREAKIAEREAELSAHMASFRDLGKAGK